MGATYTRQSTYTDGDIIQESDTNDEFDQLLAAFAASTGHTHDGTTGEGGPVTKLLGTGITIGDGTSGTDITVTFDGESNDGVIKWMEDEDYFEFSDDMLVASTEKIQFRDTAIYINSSTDGQLDIVADTEIQIAATTVDINGNVDISGTLTVGSAGISEAELEILDGASVTTAELNLIDGDTARGTTAVASGDGILINDAGTMRMTNVDTVSTYFAGHSVGGSSIVTTGALNSGSITSGFGTIDTGSSTITTTGLISGGSLDIDSVLINGTTIGHTDDTDLITLADGVVTVAGELDAVSLDVSGSVDIDGTLEADAITINGTAIGSIYSVIAGSSSIVTTGALNSGSITSGFGTIDTGSSTITTTGLISGGSLDIDDVLINGATIGHTNDTDLITLADGVVTVAGEISVTTLDIGGTNVTSTAAELNILDGKAFLDEDDLSSDSATGIPSQQSIKAYVDNNISSVSASSTTTFTNKTLTAPKIVDGGFIADANGNELVVFQTTGSAVNQLEVTNNASGSDPILAATGDDTNIGITLTPKGTGVITIAAGNLDYGGTAITSTGAELNLVDGSSAGTIVNSKGVIYSSGGVVNATSLSIAGTALTATAAEYNLLDGGSTVGTTAVADGDGLLTNDGGTMRQTTVQTFATYFAAEITAMSNLVTTGALNSGSITSGFGTIDTGASAITTTGIITGGTLEATTDTAAGDNAAIGYTAAEGLILTGQGSTNDVTIKNDADADVIEIPTGTTNVTVAGALKPVTYQETYSGLTAAATVTCDLSTANHFAVTMDENTTFAFTNPPTSGTSFAFTLIVTQHSTAVTITWPGSVDWAGGSAPDVAGDDAVQAYGFITRDAGTTYYGFLGGTAIG